MNPSYVLILVLAAFCASPSIAQEDHSDANISQLKGQLVPDGERHQYLLDYKTWNIGTNPFGILYGSYSANVSYAFHKNFAARIDATQLNLIHTNSKITEVAVSMPVFFRKVYSGYSVEPGMLYRTTKGEDSSNTIYGPQVMIAHSWYWDSGLNFSLGAGIARDLNMEHGGNDITGNAYLRVNYAFNP